MSAGPAVRDGLSVKALRKSFVLAGTVLDGIDLEISSGMRVAILGSNGTGKSTFLKCVAGQLAPDAGQVELVGVSLDARADRKTLAHVRRHLGFVFQQPALVRQQSVLSNVCHGLLGRRHGWRAWNQRITAQADREAALRALMAVGLEALGAQVAASLSGGQAQRVAIARALVGEPELVLADEPTASLDPAAGRSVMQLLAELARDKGKTLLFTTHNIDHAFAYADRVVLFSAGQVIVDTPASPEGRRSVDRYFSSSSIAASST